MKAMDPDCAVIMLTSLVNRQTVEECLHLGALAYLRKDNPPDDMLARLKKIVDGVFGDKPEPPASP
jgi:two-component system chemotaxis response regulator CheY